MQRNKNFYRYELLKLAELYGDAPLVFTGIYKHADHSDWVTLSTLKLFGTANTKILCSHINLKRLVVEQYLILSIKENQKKIYLVGNVKSYQHYGTLRGGLSLIEGASDIAPIWLSRTSIEENQEIARRIQFRQLT